MTCSGRTNKFQAWTRACRSLSHLGMLAADREADPAIAGARIPGVDRLLVALVAPGRTGRPFSIILDS